MNKIYILISEMSDKFREMCYGLTQNETDIQEAVQELMLYFLQMNPETLKAIYDKDGEKGIRGYGAVVLKRALTSKRSPFYYKYKKYYTHLKEIKTDTTEYKFTASHNAKTIKYNSIYNMPENIEVNYKFKKLDKIDKCLDKMYWYDKKIFELYYYESNTLDSLAKGTGISRNSLFTTIDKVRELLKKELLNE